MQNKISKKIIQLDVNQFLTLKNMLLMQLRLIYLPHPSSRGQQYNTKRHTDTHHTWLERSPHL